MELEKALQIVKAAGYRVSKPKLKEKPALNALGKPFSSQYDPNYKMRHRVTPISRLFGAGWRANPRKPNNGNPWA